MQAPGRRPRKGARRPGRAGSALRERGHGGGDHPVPSRTRQLSPPSPRVLQRQAAGGQDAALAQGASFLGALEAAFGRPFLFPRRGRRAARTPSAARTPLRGAFLFAGRSACTPHSRDTYNMKITLSSEIRGALSSPTISKNRLVRLTSTCSFLVLPHRKTFLLR